MRISPDVYFKTLFEWLSLAKQFASLTAKKLRLFEHRYFTGSVTTHLGCGGYLNITVTNYLLSLTVKEF